MCAVTKCVAGYEYRAIISKDDRVSRIVMVLGIDKIVKIMLRA